ncbi:MAG TPA: hypothetical protein VE978_15720 [Chitinophagales bacterium]|nr:hypothetical protein [Chitinophagales bacterium]
MNKVTYTSTLSTALMKQLSHYAAHFKVQKKIIIETALKKHFEELRRKELAESFKRVAKDREMKELAEDGLGDYLKMLDR